MAEETETPTQPMFKDSDINIRPTKESNVLLYQVLKQVWSQIVYLFSHPVIYSTALASSLLFSNMFGYDDVEFSSVFNS